MGILGNYAMVRVSQDAHKLLHPEEKAPEKQRAKPKFKADTKIKRKMRKLIGFTNSRDGPRLNDKKPSFKRLIPRAGYRRQVVAALRDVAADTLPNVRIASTAVDMLQAEGEQFLTAAFQKIAKLLETSHQSTARPKHLIDVAEAQLGTCNDLYVRTLQDYLAASRPVKEVAEET